MEGYLWKAILTNKHAPTYHVEFESAQVIYGIQTPGLKGDYTFDD